MYFNRARFQVLESPVIPVEGDTVVDVHVKQQHILQVRVFPSGSSLGFSEDRAVVVSMIADMAEVSWTCDPAAAYTREAPKARRRRDAFLDHRPRPPNLSRS